MNIKQKILFAFETQRGEFISGEKLALDCGVSRAAIWKAVRSLQQDGYQIDAVTNKGYRLALDCDMISAESIEKYLLNGHPFQIEVFRETDSTNDRLRELAENGAAQGRVILAEAQTAGRGRMERRFYSPQGTGVYFSLLLRPKIAVSDALFITTAAAVSVAEAIEINSGRPAMIKWVNDIYCGGKKVCGILTEASFNMENGIVDYAILGIGINVRAPRGGFPAEIRDIAGAVFEEEETYPADARSRLAAQTLSRFWEQYLNLSEKRFLPAYRDRSMLIGREITVSRNDLPTESATALAIDDECRLIVKTADGTVKALSSGEVSVRCGK